MPYDDFFFLFRNRADVEGLSSEELELMEVAVEALTAILQHPHTHKYRSHVMKHSSNILEKFNKILDAESASPDHNKVILSI